MKAAIVSIIFILVSASGSHLIAQVSAVMQVKATIISGAGFSSLEENAIDLSQANLSGNVSAGSFQLSTAPGADISIHLKENPILINENGEVMKVAPLSLIQNISNTGNHHISINGNIPVQDNLNGQYNGSVTAVIDYL